MQAVKILEFVSDKNLHNKWSALWQHSWSNVFLVYVDGFYEAVADLNVIVKLFAVIVKMFGVLDYGLSHNLSTAILRLRLKAGKCM